MLKDDACHHELVTRVNYQTVATFACVKCHKVVDRAVVQKLYFPTSGHVQFTEPVTERADAAS